MEDRFFYKITAVICALGVFFSAVPVFAEDLPGAKVDREWIVLETGYLTVYYEPGADLAAIERNLRRRATYFSTEIPSESAPDEEKIRYQLDALFRRSQDILDMRPPNIHVKIRIFRTKDMLGREYQNIFGSPADMKSFYVNKFNTIYVSEESLTDSVIAHEMGHAIIDHYFAVIPPEKVRELLASYVDLHLAE